MVVPVLPDFRRNVIRFSPFIIMSDIGLINTVFIMLSYATSIYGSFKFFFQKKNVEFCLVTSLHWDHYLVSVLNLFIYKIILTDLCMSKQSCTHAMKQNLPLLLLLLVFILFLYYYCSLLLLLPSALPLPETCLTLQSWLACSWLCRPA